MQTLGKDGGVHKMRFVGIFAGTLLIAAGTTAFAQASGPATENAPSEAARRAAASPYRFILQNASAPRKAPAPAPAPAAEKKPAPAPVQQAAVQPERAAPAPAQAAPAPAPAPAPEPTVASVSRQPAAEPPPIRREIIPIRTDEPHLSPALLREEPKGTVKIHFDINYDGSVGEVKVMSSSNRSLNKPTVEAVKGWKFQPVDEVLTVETEIVYNMEKQ
jgi:TonB family protein